MSTMGSGHHFLYASNGPSVGQWWLAHGAGGRLIAGAIRLNDNDDRLGQLRAGEVVELTISSAYDALPLLDKLHGALEANHLAAVPVGRLMRDAGATA